MSSKLIGFIGSAGCGKTTLACALKEYFMLKQISTDVCTEYAREFVFNYGFPENPDSQYRLALGQIEREDALCSGSNKYIFSDSCVYLSYVYCMVLINKNDSLQRKTVLADIYKRFIISDLNRYHRLYYLSSIEPFDDGCKRDLESEKMIHDVMDGFIQVHKNLLPIVDVDATIHDTEKRKQIVYDDLEGS